MSVKPCYFLFPHMWFLFPVWKLGEESLLFVTSVLKFHRVGRGGVWFHPLCWALGGSVCWYMSLKMWKFSWIISLIFAPSIFLGVFLFCFFSFIEIFLFACYTVLGQISNSLSFSPIFCLCLFAPLWKISSTLSSTHSVELFTSAVVFLISKNCLFFF